MGTNKLPDNMLTGMQNYVNGLSGSTPAEKAANYDQQNGYRATFNEIEDFWNEVVEIQANYIIPENSGSIKIIVKNTGFTSSPIIELPSVSTNIGRRILIISENITYPGVIIPKTGSGDTIEGQAYIDFERESHKNRIDLIATQSGWIRIARDFCLVPENLRPTGYVLTNGSNTAWTDVSFNTWVQDGCYALLLQFVLLHVGNSSFDYTIFHLRPKGSITDNFFQNTFILEWFTNLTTGVTTGKAGQIIIQCDFNGIIQYKQFSSAESGNGLLSLTIAGYWR